MKGYILLFILILGITACNQSDGKKYEGNSKIEFSQLDFDFGTISQGEKVAHRFVFKNTGDGDLYIKNVAPSCGCTVANYTKEAIHPGNEAYIEATFNSEGYRGLSIKNIDVYTNGEPKRVQLTISATVETNDM